MSAKQSVLACLEAMQNNQFKNRQALQTHCKCGTRATSVLWEMGIIYAKDKRLHLAENIPSITKIMNRYYSDELPVPAPMPVQAQLELALPETQEQKLLGLIRSIASKLPDGTTIQIRCNGAWQIKSDGF